jgi:hypothetical protein
MKKGLWVVLILVAVSVVSSSCQRRKDACAAYNHREVVQHK